MPDLIRLTAIPTGTAGEVRFQLHFAAQATETLPECAAAQLETGDGQSHALGLLCAPSAVTWREQRVADLLVHRYQGAGPFSAHLHWGLADLQVKVNPLAGAEPAPAATLPAVALFAVAPVPDESFQRRVTLRVEGLMAGQSLRLDGGAGQVHILRDTGQDTSVLLNYVKPGHYLVSLDLLDDDGFWLATLAETPLEIALAAEEAQAPPELPRPTATISVASAAAAEPWLPYRNIRPVRSVYTYTSPGGSVVSRAVNLGYYLSVRAETAAGGRRWFQTAGGDWIAADVVTFFTPSPFRGVTLDSVAPPPPPPPPPPAEGTRRGIVTAGALNVRAAPGVSAGNPPVAVLRAGDEVTIYEERVVAGATWYRIGENRWVHGGYVRLLAEPAPPTPPPATRRGIVTADVLNVRAAPGVSAGNPPIGTLRAGTEVTIYEERAVSGATWYRIGENRWVHGGYVRVLSDGPTTRGAAYRSLTAEPVALPLGWVVADTLNVRARPGVSPDNPPVGELGHYARVPILEQTTVSGVRWFRIGDSQWIEGRRVGVARLKPRPASIGPSTKWVGVCLSEQTLVAYEGDRPVFATLVASGLPGTPTVQGIFRTWRRLETGKMAGPGYYIEDVTWTCYFYSGYALHTAYWHDRFGTQRSHGCVNLSPHDAWWIYQWSAGDGPNSPTVYTYWA